MVNFLEIKSVKPRHEVIHDRAALGIDVILSRATTAARAEKILEPSSPHQKKPQEAHHLDGVNTLRPKAVDRLRRITQKKAREASGIRAKAEQEEPTERKTSTPFPIIRNTEIKGIKKSIRPNKDWPPQIQKTYLALQQIGAQFKIVQTNGHQRQLALIVPEDWINPEDGSLQMPEEALKRLENIKIKTSKNIEDELLYFYRALRIEGNKRRRLKEKQYEKQRQKLRREERRSRSQNNGSDGKDRYEDQKSLTDLEKRKDAKTTLENARASYREHCANQGIDLEKRKDRYEDQKSLTDLEKRKDAKTTLENARASYREHCANQGIDTEEVEAILEIAGSGLLQAMMECTKNYEWRDPKKDREWAKRNPSNLSDEEDDAS